MKASDCLILTSLFLLSGCATFARIEPVKGEGQLLEYRQGQAILVSEGSRSAVGILPEATQYQVGPRLSFLLRVENHGGSVLDFSEANISAANNGTAIQVVPASQLAHEIQEQAKWTKISAALSGAAAQINAANAGYTNYYGTTSASAYGSGGYAYGTGTYSGTVDDPAKAQLAQAQASQQTNAQLSSIAANEQATLQLVQGSMLQRTTLRPADAVQGYFVVQAPAQRTGNHSFEVTVSVGEDVHRFTFAESQLQQ